MKRFLKFLCAFACCFSFAACEGASESSTTPSTQGSSNAPETSIPSSSSESIVKNKFTIYLAGDSTVKTYDESTFIGGWGQFLAGFMDNEYVSVVNLAQGGRSARSFINEGRLYTSSATEAFKVTSVESQIKEGDYLFIQFGHNDDDTKKASSYSTLYDRMVPLGTPDGNGIYPTTAGTKVATTSLPEEYVSNSSQSEQKTAKETLLKYGDTYYSYDCGGTYKWYLKQYVEFAQSKGAIPVLVTPVARVKFSGAEIIGGPGLHGENFAYVEAVRQLAKELNVQLIDLFEDTKKLLETTTSDYANFLMALKPNDLSGNWPSTFDMTYQNTSLGYTGIEATHYNKYGAYVTAAMLCEDLLANNELPLRHYVVKDGYFVEPSNNIPKATVEKIEGLLSKINIKNPNKTSQNINDVIAKINEVSQLTLTMEGIPSVKAEIVKALEKYFQINVDDRAGVTNFDLLAAKEKEIETFILANRKDPIATYELNANNLTKGSSTSNIVVTTTDACFQINAAEGKNVEVQTGNASVMIGLDTTPTEFTQRIKFGGTGKADYRSAQFTVTGACSVTIVCQSSNSSSPRAMSVANTATGTVVGTATAGTSATVTTIDLTDAGTYYVTSTGSGVYLFMIRIEYFE